MLCSNILLLVTLVEFLDATAGSNIALTTRKERMALRANINMNFLLGGACRKSVATATDYRALTKFRMNTLFHSVHLSFPLIRVVYKQSMRKLGCQPPV